ncbi:MAG: 1-deoxy-D-xylulose-5-phosphate reductoisomerase, partial [Flavobacteriales bacterium]|jgi:1-deoxy-D-xylulose-5-phosphate reductoisomerase|nr:1-deoxy-D-xylulose-5-phosphate reductoisomerase [Flavobacteriales bacterium]
VTRAQALKHPNWDMGAKITIDSASLMNKGLEAIEARWLFDLKADQIEIIVHPQSIVHSMVQFRDGSMKAQMGLPDMKLPILYAMAYPERVPTAWPRFDFTQYPALTFEPPDPGTFRNLALALEAMRTGGNAPCVLNAANEVAVELFLQDRIGFLEMSDLVGRTLDSIPFQAAPDLADLLATDAEARRVARERIPAWRS